MRVIELHLLQRVIEAFRYNAELREISDTWRDTLHGCPVGARRILRWRTFSEALSYGRIRRSSPVHLNGARWPTLAQRKHNIYE